MKKVLRPLLVLLLALTVVLGTTASAWAMPGRGMGRAQWFYGGKNNRYNMNFYFNNRVNYNNWNYGNQNWGNQNFGNQMVNQGYGDDNSMMPFSDVPAWAQKEVARMYGLGIIKGIGNGRFGSNQSLTRAQFAVLLDREFGLAAGSSGTVTFADVPASSYYYPYIEAAAPYMDYWNGPNGSYLFHPGDPATREDVIASMVVAAGLQNQAVDTSVLSKFADASEISPNLVNLVAIAVEKGLVTGSQDRSGNWYLYPNADLTRAEAATLLYRALGYSVVAPGGQGTTTTNGSGTVQVSAAPSSAAVGQPVQVTATVLNSSGQAQGNVPVTFSVNGSATLGSQTVYTNASGVATDTVYDTVAQYVTVTASAAGVSNSTTVQFTAAATANSIQLAYTPATVYAGQTATLTATVLDASNQAVANVPVTFSVTGAATLGSQTAYTNSSGTAQTTLGDATAQSVTVTASAAGLSTSTTVTFNAAVGSIQITYTPLPAVAGQPVTVSAAVYNASGQPMANVPVTFGVNGAATIGTGPVDTNSSGIALATLNDATPQTVTVTASTAGFNASASIQFTAS